MITIKKTLENKYNKNILNDMSYHIFEKAYIRLNRRELKVLYEWLKRHEDIIKDYTYI